MYPARMAGIPDALIFFSLPFLASRQEKTPNRGLGSLVRYQASLAGAPWRLDFLFASFSWIKPRKGSRVEGQRPSHQGKKRKEAGDSLSLWGDVVPPSPYFFSSLDGRKEAKEDQGTRGAAILAGYSSDKKMPGTRELPLSSTRHNNSTIQQLSVRPVSSS